jgi:deoxyribonuclease IV
MGRIGAHVSVAGGLHHAFARGRDIGCESLQVFVKNANRWQAKPLTEEAIEAFQAAHCANQVPVVAHASYLINLCSDNPETCAKSKLALADELSRCDALGVEALVIHPGAHMGQGEAAGLSCIAQSLDEVFASLPDLSCRLLLENTAGQGTTLGSTFAELACIMSSLDNARNVGVCIDSCHAFAAGYPLHTADGYLKLLDDLDKSVTLAHIGCWHLNDSKFPVGKNKDRHANIGNGEIGLEFFETLLNEGIFSETPMIVETPLGDDNLGHARDLVTLRALRSDTV